jgi:arylsulfatase A-like enzyme
MTAVAPASWRRIVTVQLALCVAVWALSLVAFLRQTDGVAERFAALARGPYLLFAAGAQLRVLPGYVLLAAMLTVLARPWLGGQGVRFVARVVVVDLAVLLAAAGPALLASPGFFDTVERVTRIDLGLVERLHGLHVLSAGFVGLVSAALFSLVSGTKRRLAMVGAGLLSMAALRFEAAPPRATMPSSPNVLLIAADSWRFDRLGVHGATRSDLTPHLDAFARTAIDFRAHHVASASTLESWTSMLTGQLPPRHGLRSMYPSPEEVAAVEQRPSLLPKQLAAAGYDTFVSSDWAGNNFDLVDYGFRRREVGPIQNFEALLLEATMRSHLLVALFFSWVPGRLGAALIPGRASLAWAARPSVLIDHAFEAIDESTLSRRPFFGVVFTSSTHLPYNARHPFAGKYTAPGYRGPHRYHVEVSAHQLITEGFSPTLPPETIQHIRDLYDGAVSDFDDSVGEIVRRLEARGLEDHTIVIVTSDHGEDLYDPGSTLGHGTNFFGGDQSTQVPFLVRVPGRAARVVPGLTRSIDLAPTVLRLLGREVPGDMQGVDLTPLIDGSRSSLDLTAFAETCYLFFPKARAMTGLTEAERAQVVDLAGAVDTLEVDPSFRHNLVLRATYRQAVIDAKDRMVRTERWKLVRIPGKTAPLVRLFDMQADPQQQQNLAGRGLPIEAELSARLDAYEPR